MNNRLMCAIDGPSGVGKSTIAKQLSSRLSYLYVDTGAMFRCLALQWKEGGVLPKSKLLLGKTPKSSLLKIKFLMTRCSRKYEEKKCLNQRHKSVYFQ